jgi:hypothetical protein
MIELTTNAGNDFVFDENFSDSSGSSLNSSMSSVTMFTDFDEDSFGTIPGDPFLRPPGENRMTFLAAQHDRMPMKPQRRSPGRRSPRRDAVYTEKEDQRPVMPKRDLSNRSLCTSTSLESKGSAVIAESLKSKPDSNLSPVFSPVVSFTPSLTEPRQLPAQTEQSAAIAESLKPKPASNLLYSALDLAASSKPFLPEFTHLPAHSERIAEYLKLLKPGSNLPDSAFDLVASSNPFVPKLGQLPAQTERSAAIAESLKPKPASNLPHDMDWAASSSSTPLKRKGSKSHLSLEGFFKRTPSNGTASTCACSFEDGFSSRKCKKEKKKKFKSSQSKEKKSSKKEKEGDRSSKDSLSPRRVSEPRQRRLSLLGKKRSVMNVKWTAIARGLAVILEDNEELDDSRSLRTCSF